MALFGFPTQKTQAAPSQGTSDFIIDVGVADFEDRVLKASMTKPVIVDFWAPWCGPCKQLMPVLETEINAAGGDVILAKVNIDENPELAQALRIQSVPTVMAFFQAQPVTGFTGARPQSDIKNLIGQLVKLARSAMPDALDIPKSLQEAATFLATGQVMEAQELYMHVLAQDEINAPAYVGLVRCLIEADAVDQADEMVLNAPDDIAKSPDFAAAKTALTLAKGAGEAKKRLTPLMDSVEKSPENYQARFDLAGAQFAAGERAQAIENLLYILQKDRGWNDDAARKELLKFFEAMGFADPLSIDGRKKLSRILFS